MFHDYTTDGSGARAQACRVPQFENVTIAVGGTLAGLQWTDAAGVGGILAFVANGTVSVDGAIRATGAGFEGGIGIKDETDPSQEDVVVLETTSHLLSGKKGSGLDGRACLWSGRGNFANAGGGGNARNAGGGGGGAAGRGGNGGMQSPTAGDVPDTAGIGGAAILTVPLERLVMGGGGGAAHQDNGTIENGADGGGVVLFVAARLEGAGSIEANGANGPDESRISDDGGPGAGGGGVVFVIAQSSGPGLTFRARGGRGGDVGEDDVGGSPKRGPGGGGGGGWIVLRGVDGTTDVAAGPSGVNVPVSQDPRGAESGGSGSVDVQP
jgi:hypothetical protein